MLDEMDEWKDQWSCQVFKVIQAYDQGLADRHKDEAAWYRAHQKQVKHKQDQVKFTEVSNETEECIWQEILMRHSTATAGKALTRPLAEAIMGVENVPIRHSSRLQGLK